MTLRQEQQAITRARLLDSASVLFARDGVAGTSIARIAEAASVSTGAIYSNFRSKEDLAVAVIERHMATQAQQYFHAADASANPAEKLRASADLWMHVVEQNPDYFPLFLEAARFSRGQPALAARFAAACQGLVDVVQVLVEEMDLPGGGKVPDDLAPTAALVIFALGNGLALQKMIEPMAVPTGLFGDSLLALATAIPQSEDL